MEEVLLDACCLINLCSTGRLPEILGALPRRWYLCTAVAGETLYVDVLIKGQRVRSLVNAQPWLDSGILSTCQLEKADETAAFVKYAARLDDGEAMCLAIAKMRSWTVASDERKGRRIATQDGIAMSSTVEILRSWADETHADSAAILEIINNVAVLGRYRPSSDAPGAEWWRAKGGAVIP